jgi:hypothetical protein
MPPDAKIQAEPASFSCQKTPTLGCFPQMASRARASISRQCGGYKTEGARLTMAIKNLAEHKAESADAYVALAVAAAVEAFIAADAEALAQREEEAGREVVCAAEEATADNNVRGIRGVHGRATRRIKKEIIDLVDE